MNEITGEQLRAAYLSPQMECYFRKKVPGAAADELRTRIEECLKFLHMSSQIDGNIPVTHEIDEIWHLWILETREYAKLCRAIPATGFIDHCSNAFANCSGESRDDSSDDIEEDVRALANYVLNYGPFTLDRVPYWRFATQLTQDGGMTVSQLNEWLSSGLRDAARTLTVR